VAEPQPEKRQRRKKTEEAEIAADAADAKQEEAEEAAAEEAEAAEPEEEKREARRGSAETTTAKKTKETVPAPRNEAGRVEVRARARYVRSAPRKARLVMQHIRGKSVADARAILTHTPRAASRDVLKLLNSAVANAENNYELAADELTVSHAYADEGPTIKRWRPRAYGRATRINKRTSHMTILLTTDDEEGR
jgi:large subunit ribosomal protein L22